MILRRSEGFTLIELMVVVAIVALLAAIAIPSYNSVVQKSRRSDGTGMLSEAAAMQERIYSESRSYVANNERNRLVLNSDGQSSREGYYTLTIDTSACTGGPPHTCYSLTATATGSQVNDTNCQTFTLNHLGQKTSSPSADCW